MPNCQFQKIERHVYPVSCPVELAIWRSRRREKTLISGSNVRTNLRAWNERGDQREPFPTRFEARPPLPAGAGFETRHDTAVTTQPT